MPSIAAAGLPFLALLAQFAQAQEVESQITFYSSSGCKPDYGDPDFRTEIIDVFGQTAKSDDDLYCTTMSWNSDDWPIDKQSGRKTVWVDTAGISAGCKLLVYELNQNLDDSCVSNYVSVADTATCPGIAVPDTFGYSYCCGDGCGKNEVQDLFDKGTETQTKRALPQVPSVDDLFTTGKKNAHNAARNVVDVKRRPAMDLMKRKECTWENKGDSKKPYLKYPGQYRVGPIDQCSIEDGCTGSVTIGYSETVSQEFGMSAGAGVSMLDIISFSVEMSYSESTAKTNSYSYTHEYSVPNGASGYVAWEPVAECAKGTFTGDCNKWDTDKEGEACFLKMVNGIPDGTYKNVLEYA